MNGNFRHTQFLGRAFGLLAVCTAIVFLGLEIVPGLEAIRPDLEGSATLAAGGKALFVYLWVPLVVMSAATLFFAPGLLLWFSFSRGNDSFVGWLLGGFVLSLFGVPIVASVAQHFLGTPIERGAFLALLVLLNATCILAASRRRGRNLVSFRGRAADVALMFALPMLVYALLAPKFHWEAMNGDGAHLLLSAAMFIDRGIPFWPPGSGDVSGYPSMSTLTEVFPAAAFVRLFGAHEAAVRMAYLPGLAMLAGALLGVIRVGSSPDRPTSWAAATGIGAALALFSFVIAYNPSYNPYFADIALPGNREPLILVGFLGFVLFFLERRFIAMAFVSTLALLTAPNGMLLIGFWLLAFLVIERPAPILRVLAAGFVILGVLIASGLFWAYLTSTGVTEASGEFGPKAILRRLRYVTVLDFQRMAFWIVPAGIMPALALVAWRRQDKLSRVFTTTTVIYVLFFYVQAFRILPHHFAPAMVLPLVVYWRLDFARTLPLPALVAALVGIIGAAWLSWPERTGPYTRSHELAARIALPDHASGVLDIDQMKITTELFRQAFPMQWDEEGAREFFVVENLALYLHAARTDALSPAVDYLVQATEPGGGFRIIAGPVEGYALYARDLSSYEQDRRNPGIIPGIAPLYAVPRYTIFSAGQEDRHRQVWDLARVVGIR